MYRESTANCDRVGIPDKHHPDHCPGVPISLGGEVGGLMCRKAE